MPAIGCPSARTSLGSTAVSRSSPVREAAPGSHLPTS